MTDQDKITELLAVLDLPEDEQEGWVERYAYANRKSSKALFEYYQSDKEYNNSYGDIGLPLSLADLAERLWAEAVEKHPGRLWQAMILVMNQAATAQQVYDVSHENGVITNQTWWLWYAVSKHKIIAALIAMAKEQK